MALERICRLLTEMVIVSSLPAQNEASKKSAE
jgi:hypothetical protein